MPVITLLSVPFAFLLGGFVFSGLLGPLAADLGISVSAAGLLQAGYALGCAFAGPFLAHWTRNRRKKPLLLTVLGSMVLLNFASILAPGFNELLFLRTALGITGALSLPLAVSIAVTLVPPNSGAGPLPRSIPASPMR
ncbi:MFS transporter [Sulfitobacter porphyrae]|uniref:MFS transporter n=1 Tax=Sulfitobacter porphyrae TaxID=1246864 RepID=A0ABW2B575_9RHOB